MNKKDGFFSTSARKGKYQLLQAEGFSEPVSGIIHTGKELKSPFPLGGIGTGYIEISPDGKFGRTTIHNEFVKPFRLDSLFSSIKLGNREIPLFLDGKICKEIRYWGHFPFLDLSYEIDCPLRIYLRAFSPFIPGDSENSNIPGICFRFRLSNFSNERVAGKLNFHIPKRMISSGKDFKNLSLLTDRKNFERFSSKRTPGGISIPFSLDEGESEDFSFVFSWYFSWFKDSGGESHLHHYGKKFSSSLEAAKYFLSKREMLEENSLMWQENIHARDYPGWLADALINSVYSLAKNTLWVDEDRPDRWYPEKGFFSHNESFTGCPITETMVCRFHGHFPLLFLFPELEYTALFAFRHFQLENGEIPFSFGAPTSLRDARYHCQHPLNSSQYVQLVYRYFLRTKDGKFLKDFYRSVKKAIEYAKTLDYDEDCLVNEHAHNLPGEIWPANQFYDIWPWKGTSCYVAGIWLATLAAGIEMARIMRDKKSAERWGKWLRKGKTSFEKLLWNGNYYRLYNGPEERSEICLANQLMGLWCTSLLGLKSLFPENHIQKALENIINLNFKKTKWGLVNGMHPDGKKAKCRIPGDTEKQNILTDDDNDHASQIFFGENLCSAMVMISHGKKKEGMEVVKRLIEAYFLKWKTPWNQSCLLSSKDGHPVWGDDYYSNMVIWALPLFLEKKDLGNFIPEKFLC